MYLRRNFFGMDLINFMDQYSDEDACKELCTC